MAETSRPEPVFARAGVEIHQLRTSELGDSSHIVVAGGQAALIDVQRDIDRFVDAVHRIGARVVAVLETHVHNDYVSGGPALARQLGVEYVVPAGAGYRLDHRGVQEGDQVAVGQSRLRALFTPGHTPHHMSYEVLAEGRVVAVLSGGSVLVGACGRTDLISEEMTLELTYLQHRSARRIAALAGPTGVGPTHGAGSFCASSAVVDETWTTVDLERTRNPAFRLEEEAFVRARLVGLPAHPAYYRHMAPLNRAGTPAWTAPALPGLTPANLEDLSAAGVSIVDARPRADFATSHLPGSVSLGLGDSFSSYLGWIFPFGTRFAFVLESPSDADAAVRQCGRIGIDSLEGHLAGGVEPWALSGRALRSHRRCGIDELAEAWRAGGTVLDVRDGPEWRDGHVPGAVHVHVAALPGRIDELRELAQPVHVHCAGGYRAALAASLLEGAGMEVVAVDGQFSGWAAAGLPLKGGSGSGEEPGG